MGDRRRRNVWRVLCAAALVGALGYASAVGTAEVTPEGRVMLTPEQIKHCEREGGCFIVTRDALLRFIRSCQEKGSI